MPMADSKLIENFNQNVKIIKTFNIDTNLMHNFKTKLEMEDFLIGHMMMNLEENFKHLEGIITLLSLFRDRSTKAKQNL